MKIEKFLFAVILVFTVLIAWSTTTWAKGTASLGEPTGYVNDYAGILNSADVARLTAICEELQATNGTELAIVLVETIGSQSIESYAQDLFETWGIGKDNADNGVLILMAVNDREWRVHTGYGVEGLLPDSLAGRIMENEAVPEFRNGDFGQGLINAATRIKSVLEGESYSYSGSFNFLGFLITIVLFAVAIVLIWLSVRIKCPRCGSKVNKTDDKEILDANYSHSGIRKRDYECTVCHHCFSRMLVIPMLVESKSSGGGKWGSGWSSGGSSGGWSSGGSFGGFGGGSSGGGGASGGW
jgi:uncharacterized protein